jgi:hypothetical protein
LRVRLFVRDPPPRVAPDLGTAGAVAPAARAGRQASAGGPLGELGIHVHVHHESAAQVGEPFQRAGLREEGESGPAGGGPAVLVARVLDLAHDVEPPRLHVGRLVLQALERDAHLHDVAVGGDLPPGLEDEVGAQVRRVAGERRSAEAGRAALVGLGERPIGLDAERIHGEDRGLAVVVEGAEEDLHVVVGADPVAVGEGGARRAMGLEGADAEVDRGGRVPDEDLGGVLARHAVLRRELREAGEQRGVRPLRLIEPPIEGETGLVEAWRLDADLAGATAVDRLGGEETGGEEE